MRTNLELDEELMEQAMQASGAQSKRAAIETALRLLVNLHAQTGIRSLRGKVEFFDVVPVAAHRKIS